MTNQNNIHKPLWRYRLTWYYCAVALTILLILEFITLLNK